MKTERIFRCILLMLGGKKLTSAELSRELEVSRRSVQRYIESREDAGFPVIMLMYGKEASNRKQEIDRQHYTIPNQRPKDKHCGKI